MLDILFYCENQSEQGDVKMDIMTPPAFLIHSHAIYRTVYFQCFDTAITTIQDHFHHCFVQGLFQTRLLK